MGKRKNSKENRNALSTTTTAARQPSCECLYVGAIYPAVFIGFFQYSIAKHLQGPSGKVVHPPLSCEPANSTKTRTHNHFIEKILDFLR